MDRNEYVKFLRYDNTSGKKVKYKWLLKHYPKVVENIIKHSVHLDIPFTQKVFHYVHNLHEIPKCLNCDNNAIFTSKTGSHYSKYCSVNCSNKCNLKKERIATVNKKKYGHECSLLNDLVIVKTKETKLERYGDENYLNEAKRRKTKLERYGDEYYVNHEQTVKTNLERYCVKSTLELEEVKHKSDNTKIIKYNDVNYNNRKKSRKTKLDRYGDENYCNREKSKVTCFEKYGVDHYSKTEESKINIRDTHYSNSENKWHKLLNIGENDIKFLNDDIEIFNYCKEHHKFIIGKKSFYNRINNSIPLCTECYPINKFSSTIELELIKEVRLFYDGKIINGDRSCLNGGEIDVYFPEFKLGIEINGLYWHSELFKKNDYHKIKTDLAIKNNIQLLQIFDDEWISKKNIILSMLKYKLKGIKNRIYARKCEIRIVDSVASKPFLINNHIQGNNRSKIKIGLYHDNELVSLMTFETTRNGISKTPNSFLLSRFCNKTNHIVIGSADKLLKYFIREFKPSEIITFADKRYSYGDLYFKLGFEKVRDVAESYYIFHKNKYIREHRFNYRKQILIKMGFDSNKTEREILKENNFLKIYDSGKIKFRMIV